MTLFYKTQRHPILYLIEADSLHWRAAISFKVDEIADLKSLGTD